VVAEVRRHHKQVILFLISDDVRNVHLHIFIFGCALTATVLRNLRNSGEKRTERNAENNPSLRSAYPAMAERQPKADSP
jgi:hypothetical protein